MMDLNLELEFITESYPKKKKKKNLLQNCVFSPPNFGS